MISKSLRPAALSAAVSCLWLCAACGGGSGDDEKTLEPDAGKSGATPDAGKPDASPSGAREDAGEPVHVDASEPPVTGETNPCSGGQIFCDDTCIDAIEPTGTALTARVFKGSCGFSTSCHGGTSPKKGLALDTVDHLFSTAVEKRSTELPSVELISPNGPVDSYLLDKLLGQNLGPDGDTGELSTIMPQPPSDPLCPAKIEVVRAWIQAGAPR